MQKRVNFQTNIVNPHNFFGKTFFSNKWEAFKRVNNTKNLQNKKILVLQSNSGTIFLFCYICQNGKQDFESVHQKKGQRIRFKKKKKMWRLTFITILSDVFKDLQIATIKSLWIWAAKYAYSSSLSRLLWAFVRRSIQSCGALCPN